MGMYWRTPHGVRSLENEEEKRLDDASVLDVIGLHMASAVCDLGRAPFRLLSLSPLKELGGE